MEAKRHSGFPKTTFCASPARGSSSNSEMRLPSSFDNPMHRDCGLGLEHMHRIGELLLQYRDEGAEICKKKYDKTHEEKTFKVGDLVWWREHEPASTLAPKRTGPFKVVEALSNVNYRLEEVVGQTSMGRRHPVAHVQHIEAYTVEYVPTPEQAVDKIIRHRLGKKSGQRIKYLAKWSDGTKTWEPKENFIDLPEGDGAEPVINEALEAYWGTREGLRRREGY